MSAPNRIREIRLKRGLSQARLAERLNTSQSQIDRLEKGERKLTVEWLKKISEALDVFMGQLLVLPLTGEQINKFQDQDIKKIITIPVREALQSASSMEFIIGEDKIDEIPAPPGLEILFEGDQNLAEKTVFAFKAPNHALDPRWHQGELLYLTSFEDYKNNGNEFFSENTFYYHYAITLNCGERLLTRIISSDEKKYKLYYNDGREGQKFFFLKRDEVKNIYRIFEWEELLYGIQRRSFIYKIEDLI